MTTTTPESEWTIDAIVADIAAAAESAATPDDLRVRLESFAERQRDKIAFLRSHMLLNAVEFIEHMQAQGETDREAIDRIVAQELAYAAAMIVSALYRRLGQPASAGRYAIVAHTLFRSAQRLPMATEDAAP